MTRVAIIYNPIAGGSRGEAVSRRVEEGLTRAGREVERIATRDRAGALPLAADVAGRVDQIVAVGGDGTLREVVSGLGEARSRVVVGVVPMGNANIVAHELGIPTRPEQAIETLVTGRVVDMDLGTLRTDGPEELFLGVVGVGWDADAVRMLDRIRHTRMGRQGYRIWADGLYGVTGVAAALRLKPVWFTVTADGAPASAGRYCAAFLSNLRTYAKGLAVTPDAHPTSGKIHFQGRKSALPPALAAQMGAALIGRRAPARVSDYADGTRFELAAERPFSIQVDGDDRGEATRLEVSVLPSAVRIVAGPTPTRPRSRPR